MTKKLNNKDEITITKAIIPVAGYGTRLYPITKIINKEFLPVIDKGLIKPQIAILLENIYDSGLKEICLCVSSKEQIKMYKNYFCKKVKYKKSIEKDKIKIEHEKKMMQIGDCLKFIINKNVNKGFGYSVSLFQKFANGEPVAMFLGDTLYKTNNSIDCITQLLNAYKLVKAPILGITRIPLKEVEKYGICSGKFINENIIKIDGLIEKPTIDYVRNNMIIKNGNNQNYYKVFGNYIITSEIFEVLKKYINETTGESQLTMALDNISKMNKLYGIEIDGKSLDFGNVKSYSMNFTKI